MEPLFEVLTPPPDGLASLRARLDRERRRRWTLLPVAVAALVLFVVWPRPPGLTLTPDVGLVGLGLAAAPAEPVTPLEHTAARQVPTGPDQALFYWVTSL